MRIKEDGESNLIRFEIGETLPDALVELATRKGWTSGSISGIGGVESVTLAYFDLTTKQYLRFEVEGIVELVSLLGNLAILDGKPFWHLHAAVADRNGNLKAGHLINLRVAITAECWVRIGKIVVNRAPDEYTGLNLLSI